MWGPVREYPTRIPLLLSDFGRSTPSTSRHSLLLWLRPLRGRVAPDRTPNLRRQPCTKQPQAVLDWPTFWDYVSTPSTPILGDPKALPKARAMMSDSRDSCLLQTPKHRARSSKQHFIVQ